MRILLVNDDGINGLYLKDSIRALEEFGEVLVSVPSSEKSGASISLTVYKGATYHQIDERTITVDGTPADSAFIGLRHFDSIDLVVSGANVGPNESYDTLFSGTVGAGLAASLFSKKVIMLSADFGETRVYEKTRQIMKFILDNHIMDICNILSVNYPFKAFPEPLGYKVGRIDSYPNDEMFNKDETSVKTYRKKLSKYI